MSELKGIFRNWEDKLDKDEWYFSNSFEKITEGMRMEEAFNYIPSVINELLQLESPYLIGETLDLLHSVYSIANTTEIHSELKNKIVNIDQLVCEYGDEYSKNSLSEFKQSIRLN
ncbi:ABC transporter [Bacillus carboniphilus]|uniref:ABC transporter n=1 Tax=Bacillus carboniphilus TaxID=86663 RepID=A0ABY9JUR6_9BACI|nr:ABC transporter [Bacillus carboniphilus]WLR42524.1 ABC transporter [Bacillus carboniphilus]